MDVIVKLLAMKLILVAQIEFLFTLIATEGI